MPFGRRCRAIRSKLPIQFVNTLTTSRLELRVPAMPAFEVSQSIDINSDPNTVFDHLREFKNWKQWSPWILADPKCELSYTEPTDQVGGGYRWHSQIIGEGEMKHLEIAEPVDQVAGKLQADLQFIKPWKSQADVQFIVRPTTDSEGSIGTIVTWNMKSTLPIFMFWMKRLMVSMISMDYDRGLRMLKALIETGKIESETQVHGIETVGERRVVGRSTNVRLQEIGPAMERDIREIHRQLSAAGIATDGTWMAIYNQMNLKTQALTYFVGMEVGADVSIPSGLQSQSVETAKYMHVSHHGCYQHLGNAWFTAHQRIRSDGHKYAARKPSLEVYRNNPDETPSEELLTDVYVPVK